MAAFLKVDTGCREGNSDIPPVNFKISRACAFVSFRPQGLIQSFMFAQHFRLMLMFSEAFEGCKYSDL